MARQQVEELGPELQLRLFPEPEILEEGDIAGPLSGGAQRVAPSITERSQSGRREDRCVELLDVGPLEAVRQGVSRDVWPLGVKNVSGLAAVTA